jgi:nicotinate-nucleotide adenylyltransferase
VQRLTKVKKIGLLGGTFDPVHKGHMAVASHILRLLALDAVWFIPAASPPHKFDHGDALPITCFQDRVTMLNRALAPYDKFEVSRIEAERSTPSYSIDTLREFRKRAANKTSFFFILGADAFAEIDTWKEYSRLTDFADLVIISRGVNDPGIVENTIRKNFPAFQPCVNANIWVSEDQTGNLIQVFMDPVPISSTMVRLKVRKNLDFSNLVPAEVAEYIRARNLYRSVK